MNLVDMIDGAAAKFGEKAMIVSGAQSYSYAEAMAASHRAARHLSEAGIVEGDRIAVMALNTPEFIIAAIAIWRLGASIVPVNHKLSAPEVRTIADHSAAKLLLYSKSLERALETDALSITAALLDGEDSPFAPRSIGHPIEPIAARDLAADQPAQILYTSGTTGKPKGCVHTHASVVNTATLSAVAFGMTPSDRTLIAMPIWHAAPLNNFTMTTLFVGGTIVVMREYEPEAFLRCLQNDRVTVYFGAPVSFALPLSLPGGLEGYDFSSIRALCYGGGPISADLAKTLLEAYRTDRFYQIYGMTEAGPTGTLLYPEEQLRKAGSIGRSAMAGVDMRLMHADGRPARAGETGEIWIRSASLMRHYLDNPEATNAAVEGGWYKTGDLARMDEDGYLFIVDRLQDMIISGGENVYSKEVEDALLKVEGVRDCAVIGVPHPEWGETVAAVIVADNGMDVREEAVRSALRPHLAAYKIPRRFILADTLPRTPTGKVVKPELRKMFGAR